MKNLSAEMARYGIKIADIMAVIGCSDKTIRNKIDGSSEFSFSETVKIRDTFFPGMRLEYLFAADDPPGQSGSAV